MTPLAVPVAAPETPRLMRLRVAMIALSLGLAASVFFVSELKRVHPHAVLLAPVLLVATVGLSLRYWRLKLQADFEHFMSLPSPAPTADAAGHLPGEGTL